MIFMGGGTRQFVAYQLVSEATTIPTHGTQLQSDRITSVINNSNHGYALVLKTPDYHGDYRPDQ